MEQYQRRRIKTRNEVENQRIIEFIINFGRVYYCFEP
jgi:hypothetical protein